MIRNLLADLPMLAPMLYMPADRPDLATLLSYERDLGMCSIAICLEDAVIASHRRTAARTLCKTLEQLENPTRQIFIRPADNAAFCWLVENVPLEKITGFILPKATVQKIHYWIEKSYGLCMIFPILETREALDPLGRRELAQACAAHPPQIPGARIGANDLFALLGGLRRPKGRIVYETPVGRVIDGLIEAFSTLDVRLCAPVSDRISDMETLQREVVEDMHRGLFAKTAVHPRQVQAIWQWYLPEPSEVAEARRILDPDAAAVFSHNGDMLEPACHSEWARRLLHRDLLHRSAQHHLRLSEP